MRGREVVRLAVAVGVVALGGFGVGVVVWLCLWLCLWVFCSLAARLRFPLLPLIEPWVCAAVEKAWVERIEVPSRVAVVEDGGWGGGGGGSGAGGDGGGVDAWAGGAVAVGWAGGAVVFGTFRVESGRSGGGVVARVGVDDGGVACVREVSAVFVVVVAGGTERGSGF